MLKFLHLPVVASTIFISCFSFFLSTGIAQEEPVCFMTTSSGKVVNLNNLCRNQASNQIQKARACQGPFDSDGFPIALGTELERLRVAIASAKQRNVYSSEDPEVQSALATLIAQMPFSTRIRQLQKQLKPLYKQLQEARNSEEADKLSQKLKSNLHELNNNLCYSQLMTALRNKFRDNLLF